jgi:hypothetical protein
MMIRQYIVVFIVVLATAACGEQTAPPTAPSNSTGVFNPPVPPPPQPDENTSGAATLAVSRFTVKQYGAGINFFQYSAELELMETGGKSGATLTDLLLIAPGGTSEAGCPSPVHISPGRTWDMASLSYCAPSLESKSELSRVSFRATVTDDEGTVGRLLITADVAK